MGFMSDISDDVPRKLKPYVGLAVAGGFMLAVTTLAPLGLAAAIIRERILRLVSRPEASIRDTVFIRQRWCRTGVEWLVESNGSCAVTGVSRNDVLTRFLNARRNGSAPATQNEPEVEFPWV